MSVYFDSSLLIAIYLPEAQTASLRTWLSELGSPIGLNVWQELEFRNSARQKVLRGEAAQADLARTFRVFNDDCVAGRVVRRTVPWDAAFAEAERLSRKFAMEKSCRSFDLIHVAIASISGVKEFATLDVGQAGLARTAGLDVVRW